MKPEAPPAKMTCRCGAEALLGYTDKDKHQICFLPVSVKQSLTDLINDQIGSHYIHT